MASSSYCLSANQIGLLLLVVIALIIFWHWTTKDDNGNLRKCQFKAVRNGKEGFDSANSGVCGGERACNIEGFAYVRVKGGNSYKVHEDLQNPELAALTMDQLNTLATALIAKLDEKYIKDPGRLSSIKPEYKSIVRAGILSLKRNYRTANIEENIPERSGGDTSYVIDKGAVFAMCLRDPKNNNQLESKLNNLTFVMIHELGHIFTSTFGHDKLFWNNFKFLLQEAVGFGIYEAVDYKKTGSPYCGIVVTYSPLFDASLHEYRASN